MFLFETSRRKLKRYLTVLFAVVIALLVLILILGDRNIQNSMYKREAGHKKRAEIFDVVVRIIMYAFYLIYFLILISGIVRKNRRLLMLAIVYVVVQVAVSVVILYALKFGVGRARPGHPAGFYPFSITNRHHSFPSGHMASVGCSISFLIYLSSNILLKILLLASLGFTGYSRMAINAHFPIDILIGGFLGLLAGFIGADWLVRKKLTEQPDKKKLTNKGK